MFIIYQNSRVAQSFYNEAKNDFVWMNQDEATLYSKEEIAVEKVKEILKPRIAAYQATGKNYQEVHYKEI